VCAGTAGDVSVGFYVFPQRLTQPNYQNFSDNLTVIRQCSISDHKTCLSRSMVFHHSLALQLEKSWAECCLPDVQILEVPLQPVHLNNLNPINFYLRGHLKALVYMTPVNDMLSSASKLMDDS
jgi:hypothetical protein